MIKMPKIIVIYDSLTGNTEMMASAVAKGVAKTGIEVILKKAGDSNPQDLVAADGIIMGSPTYFGQMSSRLKQLIDETIKVHKELSGKVGGAFASCGGKASGGETTLLSIIHAMLIHGMIVQGRADDKHYGVAVEGVPKKVDLAECEKLGKIVAELVKRLSPA